MTGVGPRFGVISAIVAIAILTGCSSSTSQKVRDGKIPIENFTAEQIYERGEYELNDNEAEDAAFYFSEVERLYPYSDWAKRALIMQTFAYHKAKDYESSRASAHDSLTSIRPMMTRHMRNISSRYPIMIKSTRSGAIRN